VLDVHGGAESSRLWGLRACCVGFSSDQQHRLHDTDIRTEIDVFTGADRANGLLVAV
jgi:hypothetical protein